MSGRRRVYRGNYVLAVDPAGRGTCGLALGRCGGDPRLYSVHFRHDETDDSVDVFGAATSFFDRQLKVWRPDIVAIEVPAPIRASNLLLGLYAIIAGQAKVHGIPVMPVQIASWRKLFLGHGRLDRDRAKRKAMLTAKAMGWSPANHDEAEASGVWYWACEQCVPKVSVKREVMRAAL